MLSRFSRPSLSLLLPSFTSCPKKRRLRGRGSSDASANCISSDSQNFLSPDSDELRSWADESIPRDSDFLVVDYSMRRMMNRGE